jgi:peptidyl-prolyl cis-trans isomerase C
MPPSQGLRSWMFFSLSILASCCLHVEAAAKRSNLPKMSEVGDAMVQARDRVKPWYMRSISEKYLITPVSIVLLLLSVMFLAYYWVGPWSMCKASHILLTKETPDPKQKLEKWKQAIKSDLKLFNKTAAEHSACPSKKKGGYLGQFKKDDMAANFDKICFDPKTPIQTTVGPVETQFGWHLIYIHARKIP